MNPTVRAKVTASFEGKGVVSTPISEVKRYWKTPYKEGKQQINPNATAGNTKIKL
jgi:hypothetical protein